MTFMHKADKKKKTKHNTELLHDATTKGGATLG